VAHIQRQRKFVEQETSVKAVFGKGRNTKTQNQSKNANSQTQKNQLRNCLPYVNNWMFVNKNQFLTLTLLKRVLWKFEAFLNSI
jgi:hypothetical protein